MVSRTYAVYKDKIYKWVDLMSKLNIYHDPNSSARVDFYRQASSKQLEHVRCVIKDEDDDYVEICNYCEELIENCECDDAEVQLLNDDIYNNENGSSRITRRHREFVWNRDIGDSKSGRCYVCKRIITDDNFEAGHIIAKSVGGSNHVSNLRAICIPCNKAMGTMNLEDFKKDFE